MFALIFLKILATSITLGSGGAGGVFAPSLFIGAVLGGTFGSVVHKLLPDLTAGLRGLCHRRYRRLSRRHHPRPDDRHLPAL